MSPRNTKAARLAPAALAKRHNWQPNRTARIRASQGMSAAASKAWERSAANWFGDAAVYALDGLHDEARRAARNGLRKLLNLERGR